MAFTRLASRFYTNVEERRQTDPIIAECERGKRTRRLSSFRKSRVENLIAKGETRPKHRVIGPIRVAFPNSLENNFRK